MTFESKDPVWAGTLFVASSHWTVRTADGTFDDGDSFEQSHVFSRGGLEYCVEMTMTPREGIVASVQTKSVCTANGELSLAWSAEDNERQLVGTANQASCESLDFPTGVDVPAELEDRAGGESGCSIARSPNARSSDGVFAFVPFVALALLAMTRRSQRTDRA